MRHTLVPLACGLFALALSGCSTRAGSEGRKPDAGARPASIPGMSIPLDVREFEVVTADGGHRGVFLKLSRLPTAVTHRSESSPARIVLSIAGPTGTEAPAVSFPAGDSLVTQMELTRQADALQVVLDLAADEPPDYEVLPMADWLLVRIKPPAGTKRPWAHRGS
ncbi:MAG: hypothetical protein AB7V27_11565 [Candidatus Binatia bacterium]